MTSVEASDITVTGVYNVLLAGLGPPGLPAGSPDLQPRPGPRDPGPRHGQGPQPPPRAPPHQPQGRRVDKLGLSSFSVSKFKKRM